MTKRSDAAKLAATKKKLHEVNLDRRRLALENRELRQEVHDLGIRVRPLPENAGLAIPPDDLEALNKIVAISCVDCLSLTRVGDNRAWNEDTWQWSDCSGEAAAWTLGELLPKVEELRRGIVGRLGR